MKDRQDNDKKKDEKANNDQQNIPTNKTKQNWATRTPQRKPRGDSGYTEGQSVPVPLVVSMSTI